MIVVLSRREEDDIKSEEIQSPSLSESWLTVVCRVIMENNKVMTCYFVTTLFFIAIILQR